MKDKRIRPCWRCPDKSHRSVYTESGICELCGKRLKKFTPLTDLPHVFKCKSCRGVFSEEPTFRKDHLWICPICKAPTISAWYCSEAEQKKAQSCHERETPKDPPPKKERTSTFQFNRSVRKVFQISNAVSRAAFKAQQLADKLSERRPKDSDRKGYIDQVEFDISKFNRRAQMVADMVLVKSLLEEAGLGHFASGALERILDSKLGPRREPHASVSRKTKE